MIGYNDQEVLSIGDALNSLSGAMLPERVLQDLLAVGFARVKKTPEILTDLFFKLPSDELSSLQSYFADHEFPVRLNFPQDAITFPLVTVVSNADSENVQADLLGDYLTSGYDAAAVEVQQVIGHAVHSDFQILCLTGKDSNAALWLYYVVKAILTLNIQTLNAQGLHNIVMQGRDVSLRQDLLPAMTFARMLTVTCDTYFSVRLTERVASSLVLSLFTEGPGSVTNKVSGEEPTLP
jgi:hypothetical protein